MTVQLGDELVIAPPKENQWASNQVVKSEEKLGHGKVSVSGFRMTLEDLKLLNR